MNAMDCKIETFVVAATAAASTATTTRRWQIAGCFARASLLLVVIIVVIEIGVAAILERVQYVVQIRIVIVEPFLRFRVAVFAF